MSGDYYERIASAPCGLSRFWLLHPLDRIAYAALAAMALAGAAGSLAVRMGWL